MKLMLVCTSGGHFSTMWGLKNFWSHHDRIWVTDRKGDTEYLIGRETVCWLPYQAPRALWIVLKNLPAVFRILWREKPDLVISTGASIAVNFCLVAKLLGIRFIYVESISRQENLSLSGKLVYWLSHQFYVQSPFLAQRHSRAMFRGYV